MPKRAFRFSYPLDPEGQYGVRGLDVGVPVKAARQGVEQIIEIGLTPEAQVAFQEPAAAVRGLVDTLKL